MAAPRHRVHVQQRGVGELQEEDLVGRDVADGAGVVAPGQDVEAVQADAQLWMVRRRHQPPRAGVAADVPAPGQRLIGDAQAVPAGPLGQPVQLIARPCPIVDRRR